MGNHSNDDPWPAIRRAWIERHAQRTGHITRRQIREALRISTAQASADIARIIADNPGSLTYDPQAKRYRWTPGSRPRQPIPEFLKILR